MHDRFGCGGADPERGIVQITLNDQMESRELYVYNHTDGRACGYHFDALLSVGANNSATRGSGRASSASKHSSVSVAVGRGELERARLALEAFVARRAAGITINAADMEQLQRNYPEPPTLLN